MITEGDPNHFDIIKSAVTNIVSRILHAQAPLTFVPLEVEFTNWVEIPADRKKQKVVGVISNKNNSKLSVSISDLKSANSIARLVKYSPYFDLALNDYYQALKYPQHALIFLARAIESLENSFSVLAKNQKGKGKEALLREKLGVSKSDVEYVTKRANDSHRRHASKDARAENLPEDELGECFNKTSIILASFARYLRSFGFE